MKNVRKFYECCTAHLPEVVAINIDQGKFAVTPTMTNEYGWMFNVPETTLEMRLDETFCTAFLNIMELAIDADCDYIIFDRDVDPVEYLKLYNW